jgi:arylsulfatase A-like enzyme
MRADLDRASMKSCMLLLLGLMATEPSFCATSSARPNFVFILADDLGWTDLGCQGSTYYRTPNVDRLAKEGLRLTSFYVCQNCAPTRAALLSGQYAPRTGIYTVNTLARGREEDRKMRVPPNETRLSLNKVTVAETLKSAGYATGMFGKWHLGDNGPYHPSRRGFDEAIVSAGRHFNFTTTPKVTVPSGAYLADFLTDLAVDFIEKHRAEPFFLYLPHFGVHAPYQAKPEIKAHYRPLPKSAGHRDPTYAAMIESVDQSVGRVLAALERLDLARNTVVIFTSDNGGVGGYESTEPPSPRRGITDNAPLRGGKGTLYEGGIRVPFIVRWPGVIPPGTTSDAPAVHVDLYPTLLELAGAKPPPDYPLDGISLLPVWRHPGSQLSRPGNAIYWHFPGYLESYVHKRGWRTTPVGVIRSGDFKLLEFFEEDRFELYNLKEDLSEKHDLASARPDTVRELHRKLAQWRERLHAAMPEAKRKP